MLGNIRRKVFGKSLHEIQPTAAVLRELCPCATDKMLIAGRYGIARRISSWLFPGDQSYTNQIRIDDDDGSVQSVSCSKCSKSYESESGDLVDAVVEMGEPQGTILKLLKKPGDAVVLCEAIALIETPKLTIDVESPEDGIILKYVAEEGDTVKAGTKIAVISKSTTCAADSSSSSEETTTKSTKQ